MTEKKTTAKPTASKATKDDTVTLTLDRDMTIAGEDKKKSDEVTVSKATADWIKNLPKPTPPK